MSNIYAITEVDYSTFAQCIKLENKDFASAVMVFISKYQILSDEDIAIATDRYQCSNLFGSSYPMLLEIKPGKSVFAQIKDHAGRKRFYDTPYTLNGRRFVMTSQLYGLGRSSTTRDNRTPFHNWILKKIQSSEQNNHSTEKVKHELGAFDSWEIIDENTAIKRCDKSFFEHRESGVPKSICWFFGAENMTSGESKNVRLIYSGNEYRLSIKFDSPRVRISWNTELGNLFNTFNAPGATATFVKISDDTYEVSMGLQTSRQAWLLTWHPNSWKWQDYDQAVPQRTPV